MSSPQDATTLTTLATTMVDVISLVQNGDFPFPGAGSSAINSVLDWPDGGPPVTAGQIIQGGWDQYLPVGGDNLCVLFLYFSLASQQYLVESVIGTASWFDYAQPPTLSTGLSDDDANSNGGYTRTLAGLTANANVLPDTYIINRRLAPRRIVGDSLYSATAIKDVEGNTVAAGMLAVMNNYTLDGLTFYPGFGLLMKCTGAGTWERAGSGTPDLVDSTADAPNNAMQTTAPIFGDYILQFREFADEINALAGVMTSAYRSAGSNGETWYASGYGATWADATAAAEAATPGISPNAPYCHKYTYGVYQIVSGEPWYTTQAYNAHFSFQFAMQAEFDVSCDLWCFENSATNTTQNWTFDDNGFGLLSGQWNNVGTSTLTGPTTADIPLGDPDLTVAAFPDWGAAPTLADDNAFFGLVIGPKDATSFNDSPGWGIVVLHKS